MALKQFKGAIFDLDGVITQTAATHFKAWKETFDNLLAEMAGQEGEKDYDEFTKSDYLTYVDGKPRYQGVMSFLDSRQIELPYGDESEEPGESSVCAIGNRKNKIFRDLVDEEGVKIYDTSMAFIEMLKEKGIRVGVASSSKNSRFILKKTGLMDEFETLVGGIRADELDLKGKPEPDIFVAAARDMGLRPSECLMVEDAIAGVKAGRKGNFACVIGVAREENVDELRRYGGDFTIEDLEELSWEMLERWFEKGMYEDAWNLAYVGFDQMEEKLRETLTTVGNGYFASRGCFVGEKVTKDIHYPGTYIAGLYNKVPTVIHDKKIYNNDFVNCPNWLLIDFKVGNEKFIDILKTKILFYQQKLYMKEGRMIRKIKFQDAKGRITTLEVERFASMDNPHLAAIRYKFTPNNYFEPITIRSTLDGTVTNYGVPRYRSLSGNHLNAISQEKRNKYLFLHVKTNQSDIDIYMHAKHKFFLEDEKLEKEGKVSQDIQTIDEQFTFDGKQNKTYTLEKIVSIYTSKDEDTADAEQDGSEALANSGRFSELFEKSKKAWAGLWEKADFVIDGDRFSQKVIRLHIYHLLVTASPHNKQIDAGLPARGLHGEAYRGHIFWDELFILPFYNMHFPEVARADLMYRYRRLDAAREYAKNNGYKGAMFPWQTANDGKEETQEIHYNPVSGKWDPDLSHLQRHVSIAIASNILDYCRMTDDKEFMRNYGAEMMFEISRFWASIAEYDEKDKKYHIRNVMGPDEFQEKYPMAEEGGIHDNAYTNIMVSWLFNKVISYYEKFEDHEISKITEKIGLEEEEIEQWKKIRDNMYVEINEEGILAQFKGYFSLKELDWDKYHEKYDDIRRMDRILKAEGDSPNKYKVAKQADALMTFFVLSPKQVKNTLKRMGYDVEDGKKLLEKNYNYYLKRTSHGSTLSYVVHAALLKYLNQNGSNRWEWFMNALESDVYDTQGGTTEEGIHMGVMAGTIDIIVQSFAGVELFNDHFELNPSMPAHWDELRFKIYHRQKSFRFILNRHTVNVEALTEYPEDFYIEYQGEKHKLHPEGHIRLEVNS